MVKNAEYYKQRIKDLSSKLQRCIDEIYKEAVSHRFVIFTVESLCQKLELEYTRVDFESDCRANFYQIASYLELINLKFVPCSIPVDLAFDDKVFVVPKPNLNNDEDCAAVKDIVKNKRLPTQKDLVHISKMKSKIDNYNVMLRVFESLFVVSPSRLNAHQRMTLNNILTNLELPKEGAAYLRTCYTYASEYRNHHCSYQDQRYRFKDLDAVQTQRINRYLAMLAASGGGFQNFDDSYPYLSELNLEYQRISGNYLKSASSSNNADLDLFKDANKTSSKAHRLQRKFFALNAAIADCKEELIKKTSKSALPAVNPKSALRYDKLKLLFETSIKNNLSLYNAIKPDFKSLSFKHLDSLEPTRALGFLYVSSDPKADKFYPFVLTAENDEKESLLKNQNIEEFSAYLRNETILGEQIITSAFTNNLILSFTLMTKLIVCNLFAGLKQKDDELMLDLLEKERAKVSFYALPFIKGLYYVLFKLPYEQKANPDESEIIALFYSDDLLYLAITVSLMRCEEERFDRFSFCQKLLSLFLLKKAFNADAALAMYVKGFANVKTRLPKLTFFIEYGLGIVQAAVKRVGVELKDVISLNNVDGFNPNEFIYDVGLPASLGGELTEVLTHKYFNMLLMPLLSRDNLMRLVKVNYDTSFISEVLSKELIRQQDFIRYLYELNRPNILSEVILQRMTKFDYEMIKRKLKNFTFTRYLELNSTLGLDYSGLSNSIIEQILPRMGLMIVPIDLSLTKEARLILKHHKIISVNLTAKDLTKDLANKLSAAQMSFIIFSFVVQSGSTAVRLAQRMDLNPEQNIFALKFFETLKELIKGCKPFDDKYYVKLRASQQNNDNFNLCIAYLKTLVAEEIGVNPLKNYIGSKFKHIFDLMGIKYRNLFDGIILANDAKDGSMPKNRGADLPLESGVTDKVSSKAYSSYRPFAKTVFSSLNQDLIKSKLKESSLVQDVIYKIRLEEGTLSEDTSANTADAHNLNDKAKDAAAMNLRPQNSIPAEHIEKSSFSSDNAEKLLEAINAQHAEVMDFNEFKGLCLSLKFMSPDVAVEEINDWSYDKFDEPLLEMAPEENTVYITKDLLNKLF